MTYWCLATNKARLQNACGKGADVWWMFPLARSWQRTTTANFIANDIQGDFDPHENIFTAEAVPFLSSLGHLTSWISDVFTCKPSHSVPHPLLLSVMGLFFALHPPTSCGSRKGWHDIYNEAGSKKPRSDRNPQSWLTRKSPCALASSSATRSSVASKWSCMYLRKQPESRSPHRQRSHKPHLHTIPRAPTIPTIFLVFSVVTM